MTDVHADRTYDDLPESDVATVLQVPLLWGQSSPVTFPAPHRGAHRRPAGRHRSVARRHEAPTDHWLDHPMAHTARVGLVSAALVLAVFAGGLLALSLWLP